MSVNFHIANKHELLIDAPNGLYHYETARTSPSELEFNTLIRSVYIPKIDSTIFGGIYYSGEKAVLQNPKPNEIPSIIYNNNNLQFNWTLDKSRGLHKINCFCILHKNSDRQFISSANTSEFLSFFEIA